MSKKEIKILRRGEEERWEQYVRESEDATLFHTIPWKESVEKSFGLESLYLYAEQEGEIRGILPLFCAKSILGGRSLISVPFGVYGGICALGREEEELLLAEGKRLAELRNVRYMELRNLKESAFDLPSSDLYVTFLRDLPEKKEDVLSLLPRKARAAVRQGETRFRLEARIARDSLSTFYHIFAVNKRNLGSPILPFRFFQSLMKNFGEQAFLLNVLYEGTVVSAVLTFLFKDTIIPYYSGELREYQTKRVNNFMYYKLMQHGIEQGCRIFDFGRSRRETGPYFFKKNQGFVPRGLNYQYYLRGKEEIPKLNPSNPKFDIPKRIWKSLPLPVAKLVGPFLAKNFP